MSAGGATLGTVIPGKRLANFWLIFLADDLPFIDTPGIVAHEIAHAWLGHDKLSAEFTAVVETDAANLTASWGFPGRGADPTYKGT